MKRNKYKWLLVSMMIGVLGAVLLAAGCDNHKVTRPIERMDMLQNALAVIDRFYIENADIDQLDYVAATAIISSLDDFSYVSDTVYSTGSSSNIGLSVHVTDYNEYYVDMVTPGLPADHRFEDGFHLERGDELYGVTNSNIVDDNGQPIYYRLRGVNRTAYSTYTAGGDDTTLTFTVYRDGQRIGDYAYTKVPSYMPRAYYIGDVYGDDSNVGYIRLLSFSNTKTEEDGKTVLHSAADDFAACMEQFARDGMTKLVLDLRGNGGGDVQLLASVASYFVPVQNGRTDILQLEYTKTDNTVHVYVEDNNYIPNLPLVILCNQHTASAAEALIGACRAYRAPKDTVVIGTQTFGKNVFQRTGITLEDENDATRYTGVDRQYYVTLVCGYYYIVDPNHPDGRYKAPLTPDIAITPAEAPDELTQDPEMIAANEALQ